MKKSVNQLIKYFKPEGYMLSLDARPGSREFKGQVFIHGKKTGDFVRLHAKGLEFDNVMVNTQPAKVIRLDDDEIELRPDQVVELPKEYKSDISERWGADCDTSVAIEFHGRISDNEMHGLYPCYYEVDGEKKELLATQFESHHAREVFPCVDEPAAKAKFMCQISTTPGLQVLGNTPIETDDTIDDGKQSTRSVTFGVTPKMSTYLLAFVIGDLNRKTAKTKSGVEVNVYATPAQGIESLDFALDTAVRCIDFYDDYFGVKYPLPKSDHVALPDFSSGAMENWGLITYRETTLLASKSSGIVSKQYIATVIAHELSHQWFGNLVTMQWWNDLWLNESFASLMEHIATDRLFPDWNMWQTFETSDVVSALRRDALADVQPVRQDVNHPDEISTLFDSAIVYAKGERLLKMLLSFIGEEDFRAGLQAYFQKFAYGNTTAEDLWECLGKASGKDVASLMNPWLTRPGYPVVKAAAIGDDVRLEQQRFLSDGTTDDKTWPIPLFSNEPNAPVLMDSRKLGFKASGSEHFQLNMGNNAHFISIYDERLRSGIFDQLSSLSPTDRAKLLHEMLLMVQPGLVPTEAIIDILPAYADEDNDAVWDMISIALSTINRFVLPDSDDEKRLKSLSGKLARKQYDRLGWINQPNDAMNDRRLRLTVISQMIFSEDREAIAQALSIYDESRHQLGDIDGDLRAIIMGAVVKHGQSEDFDHLLSQYKTISDADLKQDIASALTSTKDPQRVDEILQLINKTEIVKPQDLFYWYVWMLRNRRARSKTWLWMTYNWDWIEETFSGDKSYDMFPVYGGQILQTRPELDRYVEFFTPKLKEPALKRAIGIGVKEVSARVDWIERDQTAVLEKLKSIS